MTKKFTNLLAGYYESYSKIIYHKINEIRSDYETDCPIVDFDKIIDNDGKS